MVKLVPPKSMATPQIRNKVAMVNMKSHTQTFSESFCVAIDCVENKTLLLLQAHIFHALKWRCCRKSSNNSNNGFQVTISLQRTLQITINNTCTKDCGAHFSLNVVFTLAWCLSCKGLMIYFEYQYIKATKKISFSTTVLPDSCIVTVRSYGNNVRKWNVPVKENWA